MRTVKIHARRVTRGVLAACALGVVLTVGGCSGGGGITIPTTVPTSLPALPTVTLPTVTLPTATLPTRTETVTQTTTATETRTETQTGTPTATATETLTTTATETQTATRTETQTVTPTPSKTEAPVPVAESSGVSPWWWVLGLVLLAAAITSAVVLGRGSRTRRAWDDRLDKARLDARWVEESLVPQVLSRPTAAEASSVWSGAQARILAMDEELHALGAEAPDEDRAASASTLRERLASLVDAVGADATAAADPAASSPDAFRARRAAIDDARRALRDTWSPPSAPTT